MRLLTIFILILFYSSNSYSQSDLQYNFRLEDSIVQGFKPVSADLISPKVLKNINKESNKILHETENKIDYYRNESGTTCSHFISDRYEYTSLIFSKSGKCIKKIICLNPEYDDYGIIYDKLDELNYKVEFPLITITKTIERGKINFEAYLFDDEHGDKPKKVTFDKHYELLE